jgi:predicted ATPase/DNA-binding SARP family transcriptional activator
MAGQARADGVALTLLDGVAWCGRPVPGERSHALLASLALDPTRSRSDTALAADVWGPDGAPANPVKALQVLVSRLRSQTDPGVVVRAGQGYRLGLGDDAVDALALRSRTARAREAEARRDLLPARDLARSALEIQVSDPSGEADAVDVLRDAARADRAVAAGVLARTASALGDHDEALPLLLASSMVDDEATLVALLRSEGAVLGAPAALARYERHRAHVRESLGVDPGPQLQAVHAELLAADSPVRTGMRFDATSLVGRDGDLRRLSAQVRESRVTSILGPGGLGKTRLAHLLAREAEQSVVHFVELVGVAAPEDVVGEVGSALGVRDSVSGRRVLTPEQRADVRARIAEHLDRAPTLLVLDNCEHVVGAVADLVAFLVAAARDLRVITTTRAPLAIAAERVFALGQLGEGDAAELFCQRARAARPDVALDPDAVRRVVARLDGLPLAIELAAAKIRAMSVEDIARRLDNRFALLRGGDRSAPDRHQTLLAVIDWSWNLLTEGERRALRWLSVFHDGFSLPAAESVLGDDGRGDVLGTVQSLVDHSLLTVLDAGDTVRYRMLETVREFGRMQLVDAGEDTAARAAQTVWARSYAVRAQEGLWSARQVAVVRELLVEENNLADLLREAVTRPDPDTMMVLLAALSSFWTIKGEHARVISLAAAVEDALRGWSPAPELVDATVAAATMIVMNTMVGDIADSAACLDLLARFGEQSSEVRSRAMSRVLLSQDPRDPDATKERLEQLGDGEDRHGASLALMWAAHFRENAGDPEGAIEVATRALALAREDDGPWGVAMLHTLIGSLHAQLGHHEEAATHARAAVPALDLLEANDDAMQVRALLAIGAMASGHLEDAERYVEDIESINGRRTGFGGGIVIGSARAELALARGDIDEGLRLYRIAVEELRELSFPGLGEVTGLEPWTLFGESAGATAYALHGRGEQGADLYAVLRAKVPAVLELDGMQLDYPVAGMVLYGLGAWGLLREALPVPDAVRLLVLADRFAYTRFSPTMSWERTAPVAERLARGLVEQLRAEYAGRRGPELLPEARALVARLP